MNVLISDEDASTRHMIGRALAQRFSARVEEATNGLDALDKLQQESFGALVMEAVMPIMSGVETLQVLRESPQFAGLPVVIVTNERDERLVTELVKLGVQDIILKPVTADRFVERFERVLSAQAGLDQGPRVASGPQPGGRLAHGAAALVADGDVQYREYFRRVAGARFALTEAASGAKALEMCLKDPPYAVFLGTNLGVIGYERIVSRLRAVKSRRIRIFAMPAKSEAEAVRALGIFDDVLARTYVPATLEKELARLGQPLTASFRLREQFPDLRTRIVSAVEQVFGTMLMTDVEPQAPVSFGDGPRGVAMVTLTSDGFEATVRTRIEMSAGRDVAGALLQKDKAALADEHVLGALGELTQAVVSWLVAEFQERQLECVAGPPVTGTEARDIQVEARQADNGEDVHFRATDRPLHFQVTFSFGPLGKAMGKVTDDEDKVASAPTGAAA